MQFVPIAPLQPTMVGSPSKLQPPSATEETTCVVLTLAKETDPNNNPKQQQQPQQSRKGVKRSLPVQAPESAAKRPAPALRGGKPVKQGKNVLRRNERERNRVKQVNLGFDVLRQHVPNGAKNKKMSKVDTLRSAAEYIKYLQTVLDSDSPLDMEPFHMELSDDDESTYGTDEYPASVPPPPPAYSEPLPGSPQQHHHHHSHLQQVPSAGEHQENSPPFSPGYHHHTPGTPHQSLPSPGGYSTDGSQGSEHYSEASTMERQPLSPEDQQLIEFASWLQFQS